MGWIVIALLGWTVLAVLFGVLIGQSIRIADGRPRDRGYTDLGDIDCLERAFASG